MNGRTPINLLAIATLFISPGAGAEETDGASLAANASPAVTDGGGSEAVPSPVEIHGVQGLAWQRSEGVSAGAAPLQPEFTVHPTEADKVCLKLGLAAGNGLNAVSPYAVPHWAADLEEDVDHINGGDRNHLLTAWYRHLFDLGGERSLGASLGIIDATDYLDDNAYANDEYTQFMNAALVNGPNVFLPSYDRGAAIEWLSGRWSVNGVYMNVGGNDAESEYDFYAAQLGYTATTPLGEGHYRILADGTSRSFPGADATSPARRSGLMLSFDQQVGDVLGFFVRLGRQGDAASIDYRSIRSCGIDINGRAWGRETDNIGLGYAFMSGGNQDLEASRVAEVYYRLAFNDHFALAADIQHMQDTYRTEAGTDGFIYGFRGTFEF